MLLYQEIQGLIELPVSKIDCFEVSYFFYIHCVAVELLKYVCRLFLYEAHGRGAGVPPPAFHTLTKGHVSK